MDVTQSDRGTHRVAWDGGALEVNLAPMNVRAAEGNVYSVGYATVDAGGRLGNTIADMVGGSALALDGCPPAPRILWDNREHHFWDGFDGRFEPRNTAVNAPRVETAADGSVRASYYYVANAVKTTVSWRFREPSGDRCKALWDTTIEVENLTGRTLRGYQQFNASYHKAGTNYYWDASGELAPCSPVGFNAARDSAEAEHLRRTSYGAYNDRIAPPDGLVYAAYARPVLVSEPRPWFGGGRHVLMVAPETCAAVVTWREQARDYLIRPAGRHLEPRESFTARARHIIARVGSAADISALWSDFEHHLAGNR